MICLCSTSLLLFISSLEFRGRTRSMPAILSSQKGIRGVFPLSSRRTWDNLLGRLKAFFRSDIGAPRISRNQQSTTTKRYQNTRSKFRTGIQSRTSATRHSALSYSARSPKRSCDDFYGPLKARTSTSCAVSTTPTPRSSKDISACTWTGSSSSRFRPKSTAFKWKRSGRVQYTRKGRYQSNNSCALPVSCFGTSSSQSAH